MRLKNPFKKTGKGEARFRILREDVASVRQQLRGLQESIDRLLERPGPDTKTYEHTPEDRGTVKLVSRSSDFYTGLVNSENDRKSSDA